MNTLVAQKSNARVRPLLAIDFPVFHSKEIITANPHLFASSRGRELLMSMEKEYMSCYYILIGLRNYYFCTLGIAPRVPDIPRFSCSIVQFRDLIDKLVSLSQSLANMLNNNQRKRRDTSLYDLDNIHDLVDNNPHLTSSEKNLFNKTFCTTPLSRRRNTGHAAAHSDDLFSKNFLSCFSNALSELESIFILLKATLTSFGSIGIFDDLTA